MKDRVRDLEDKNKTAEYKLHFTKQLVKEREKELENLAKEKENYEQGKAEKLKQEKKIEDLNGKVNTYKQDIK